MRGVAVMYRPFVVWMVAPVGGVSVVGEGERTCAGVPGSGHASTNPIRLQGQAVLFAQCCAAQACLISRPTGGHGHGRRVGRHGKVVAPAEHGKRDDGLKQRKLVADALALAAACWGGGHGDELQFMLRGLGLEECKQCPLMHLRLPPAI